MNLKNLIGQTLDSKYLIEKELGQGGMGAVYLATHLGTERPVALKVIAPQFMQRTEFVERFRREARAAGRLRHPNVVDVTDFGFANTLQGQVAYLVMEYLDGCTLGEILEEEKHLPLDWTLDILEQVCSAVSEAHEQGIIHRDLKPDNIWLEPNLRGGYTVKVLDFGIAKLEEPMSDDREKPLLNPTTSLPTQSLQADETFSEQGNPKTMVENKNSTVIGDKGTLIQTDINEKGTAILPSTEISLEKGTAILPSAEVSLEDGTAILPNKKTQIIEKEDGTKLLSVVAQENKSLVNISTSQLTRVGAVLGTPLYMSPEQCRGEKLTPCSDIYSLGVILYQMLSGKTPFVGDFTQVMDDHKETVPPPLEANDVPKKVKEVLFLALSKNPNDRPQTAKALSSKLRSHSESAWNLMGKAMVFYSENFIKLILLATLLYVPMMVLFILSSAYSLLGEAKIIEENFWIKVALNASYGLSGFFSAAIMSGIIAWLVAQKMSFPMRPLLLRPAFKKVKSRLKRLLGATTLSFLGVSLGWVCLLIPGFILWVCWSLVTPVAMLENVKGRQIFARSYQLVRRKLTTAVGVLLLTFFLSAMSGVLAGIMTKGILGNMATSEVTKTNKKEDASEENKEPDFKLKINNNVIVENKKSDETEVEKQERRFRGTVRETFYALIQIPLSILVGSFFAVVLALLYINTRLAGGESMSDLLEQFEESDQPKNNWQKRMHDRLIQSGRVTTAERK